MKVRVYSTSLLRACEAYIADHEAKEAARVYNTPPPRPKTFWDKLFGWLPDAAYYPPVPDLEGWHVGNAKRLAAIAKHKAHGTMLEITDEELGPIALFLAPYEPERI
jgi:hypothetical protein